MVAVFHIAGGLARQVLRPLHCAPRRRHRRHRRGHRARRPDLQHSGALAGRGAALGARRARRLGAAPRSGAADPRAPARPRVDLLRAWLPHRGHIGEDIYMGRMLLAWAILTSRSSLRSQRRAVREFSSPERDRGGHRRRDHAVFLAVVGSNQSFIPFGTRVWAWIAIAAVPLIIAAFHGHKGLIPSRHPSPT